LNQRSARSKFFTLDLRTGEVSPSITPLFLVAETAALELSIGKYRYYEDNTAIHFLTAVENRLQPGSPLVCG
jgi:hypothetical protein